MKQTRPIMGMPITIEVADALVRESDIEKIFAFFRTIDERFSPFKATSEVSRLNSGLIREEDCSADLKAILAMSEETRRLTDGYFDIRTHDGRRNPSGLVKGLAIQNAARLLDEAGFRNFFVEAGGDIQVRGENTEGPWQVGIRNPFTEGEIVKVVALKDQGIATSGTYIRGQHIYNPFAHGEPITDIVSLTVIGPNVFDADRFATAAFAMGRKGIDFIERLEGFEGYMIDRDGNATMTTHFDSFTHQPCVLSMPS